MSKAGKIFAIILGSAAVMFLGSSMLLAWSVATHGVVRIAVDNRESGTRFDVPVPAAMIGAAMHMSPCLRQRIHLGHEAELERLRPALVGFFAALADAPDAVLVDVEDGEEHVQIRKSGRNLEVLVKSPDADVRVSMPARLLHRIVRETV